MAVVSTRNLTGVGWGSGFRLGYDLAADQVPVVSGLASGIDIAAHRGAVAVAAAKTSDICATIGVLGCGINYIYP